MKKIVVSAVNLRKGGTLTILRDCLEYLSGLARTGEYEVIALVHRKDLTPFEGIEFIEMPDVASSWLKRLWCEYVTMNSISKRLSPVYLWLSLHDATPNVKAEKRAVYCHNPFPFYKLKVKDIFLNYRIFCFACFSRYIYRINIRKNELVLVQQQWIRNAFVSMFRLDPSRIAVALPASSSAVAGQSVTAERSGRYTFIFPSYCDVHKNFETVCKAAECLEREVGAGKFRVVLTVSRDENRYTRWLCGRWGGVSSIDFAGFMPKEKLYELYGRSDCLIFPSLVETWGLPISEFAAFGKPMLLADLPYAHETAAGSRMAAFFSPDDHIELKNMMKRLLLNDVSFLHPVPCLDIEPPVTRSWKELFDLLLA